MNTKKGFLNYFFIFLIIALCIFAIGTGASKLSVFSDETSFSYTQDQNSFPLKIGDMEFSPSNLQYTCGDIGEDEIRYPDPRPDCWRTKVNFEGKSYVLYGGENTKINEYLSVTMNPRGKVIFDNESGISGGYIDDNWRATYNFIVKTDYIISSQFDDAPYYVKLDGDKDFLVTINNNMAHFDKDHAGVWVRQKHYLLERGEGWESAKMSLNEGSNKYLIKPDASELGKAEIEIQPYIIIDADQSVTIRQDKPIKTKYEVVMDLPDDVNNEGRGRLVRLWESIKDFFLGWFN